VQGPLREGGVAAAAAVHRLDVSAAALRGYEIAWHRRFERELQIAYATHRQLPRHGDAEWEALFAGLRKLSPLEFAQGLKGEFSLRWGLGLAWKR
jgi:uncharacterized protein YbjT (DUF2867 family)